MKGTRPLGTKSDAYPPVSPAHRTQPRIHAWRFQVPVMMCEKPMR